MNKKFEGVTQTKCVYKKQELSSNELSTATLIEHTDDAVQPVKTVPLLNSELENPSYILGYN